MVSRAANFFGNAPEIFRGAQVGERRGTDGRLPCGNRAHIGDLPHDLDSGQVTARDPVRVPDGLLPLQPCGYFIVT